MRYEVKAEFYKTAQSEEWLYSAIINGVYISPLTFLNSLDRNLFTEYEFEELDTNDGYQNYELKVSKEELANMVFSYLGDSRKAKAEMESSNSRLMNIIANGEECEKIILQVLECDSGVFMSESPLVLNVNMSDKVLNKKIDHISNLFNENINKAFFIKNFVGLSSTLNMYLILKKSLHEKGVEYYSDFKSNFSKFYKLQRFTTTNFEAKFYCKMQELVKNKEELDFVKVTKSDELNDGDKIQFSFLTKMFNIIDDDKYPIYDSNVATALKISRSTLCDINDRKESYLSNYRGIQNIYKALAISQKEKITLFKEVFGCPDLSDVRVLDFIVWKLGEEIVANKKLK